MLLRRFTDFVLHGRVQAMALAFVCAFIPLIGSIGILMAAFITLRKSVFEGALVTLAATVPYLLGYLGYSADDRNTVTLLVITAMCASNVLTWLAAVLLRRYSNWSLLLEIAGFVGVFAVIAVHLFFPDSQQWWQAQLTDYFAKSPAMLDVANNPEAARIQAEFIQHARDYATGLTVASVLFNALLQLVLARWWQAVMFNPGGLQAELWYIRLGYGSVILLAALFGLAFFGNQASVDAMSVQFGIFCAAGLSLVHYLIGAKGRSSSWLLLLVIYTGFIFLFPFSAVIISVIALLDTLFNFRQRFRKLNT